jgi:hypothetical protein
MKKMLLILLVLLLTGCSKVSRPSKLYDGLVVPETANVHNSTGQVALKIATLRQGDSIEVLEKHKKDEWVRVRTSQGVEGWMEARHVVRKELVERATAWAEQLKHTPTQAVGRLSGNTTLRLSPGRASEENVILTLAPETQVEILDRQRTLRESNEIVPKDTPPKPRPPASSRTKTTPGTIYDPWFQVRVPGHALVQAGWVYAPLVELQIPQRLIHFQGAYNIVGWFEVGQVEDPDIGAAAHYLALERDRFNPRLETDFDRLVLYVWDSTSHEYFSSIQHVPGVFPVLRETQNGSLVFLIKTYDRKTGRRQQAKLLVDSKDPNRPRLVRPKS